MAIAYLAAAGCAACNGLAAVLQKLSADRMPPLHLSRKAVYIRLLQQLPYILSIGLDLTAGILTLVATHRLALIIVQPIIASSVVVTVILERIFFKTSISRPTYLLVLLVFGGLACLSLSPTPQHSLILTPTKTLVLCLLPLLQLMIGTLVIRWQARLAGPLLAIISGTAFGNIAVIGRVLAYPKPLWELLSQPLSYALAFSAILGLFFFTAALQRGAAGRINALMVAAETIIPILLGIFLLADHPTTGSWPLLSSGLILVLIGCLPLALSTKLQHQ